MYLVVVERVESSATNTIISRVLPKARSMNENALFILRSASFASGSILSTSTRYVSFTVANASSPASVPASVQAAMISRSLRMTRFSRRRQSCLAVPAATLRSRFSSRRRSGTPMAASVVAPSTSLGLAILSSSRSSTTRASWSSAWPHVVPSASSSKPRSASLSSNCAFFARSRMSAPTSPSRILPIW